MPDNRYDTKKGTDSVPKCVIIFLNKEGILKVAVINYRKDDYYSVARQTFMFLHQELYFDRTI